MKLFFNFIHRFCQKYQILFFILLQQKYRNNYQKNGINHFINKTILINETVYAVLYCNKIYRKGDDCMMNRIK